MTGSGSLLIVGPAHAGKVELLLDRYVEALGRDPWLIVPNRADVERVERELVERRGGLLAGTVGTFDTLFGELARADGEGKRLLGDAERAVVLRRLVDASQAQAAPGRPRGRRRARPRGARRLAARCGRPARPARSAGPRTARSSPLSTPGIAEACGDARSSG